MTNELRPTQQLPVRSLLVDLLLAVFAVYFASLLTAEALGGVGSEAPRLAAHCVAALHGASVVVRRLATPAAVVALIATAAVYGLGLGLPAYMLGPAVLFVAYAVGSQFRQRTAVTVLSGIVASLLALLLLGPSFPGWDSAVLFAALVTASWFLGVLARRWQTLASQNAQRALELERARNELARHAVAAERLRIARELHDVVAHSMSVIAMHAGAARLAVGTDPDSERVTLDVIERSSRSALGEMRRLVTVLRDEDDMAAARGPAPTVAELHSLVAGVVAAGASVDVRTEGDLDGVPAGISLAAYRVVQEALTNVVRHAGPTHARLLVRAGRRALVVRVEDDGPSRGWERVPTEAGGHGAIGMRERVELYGGTLTAGPAPGGGWTLEARLPYAAGEQ